MHRQPRRRRSEQTRGHRSRVSLKPPMLRKLPTGYIFYRGPSLLTGAPIVAVVIAASSNEKTGSAAQSYILADNGQRPTDALLSGADAAVCGDCKHRPANAGTCYVVVRQGPMRVWMSLQRGNYPDLTGYVDIASEILAGRVIRIGTYGDPASVPVGIWRDLLVAVDGYVGYTHQWRQHFAQPLRDFCMASVDSVPEHDLARSMGWRTFRVRLEKEPLLEREAVCPASEEGGRKLHCDTCRACDGSAGGRRGGVAIVLHGNHPDSRAMRFIESRQEQTV